jgi:hypothetical protein
MRKLKKGDRVGFVARSEVMHHEPTWRSGEPKYKGPPKESAPQDGN